MLLEYCQLEECDALAGYLSAVVFSEMRIAGLLLMIAGWVLALATIVLLGAGPAQMAFLLVSIGIELAGFGLTVRSHIGLRSEKS